ncbi:MAG TPA: EamA family transporter [Gallionella sp.]|nr:EamA family transporter [Gallionella sp.]
MKPWIGYALTAMLFAGMTTVIAKHGLNGISGELGVVVRSLYVALFVGLFALLFVAPGEWQTLQRENLFWLAISSFTTAVSWIYFYKALKEGDIATVTLIDKGSTVVAIFLAWLIFKEVITPRIMIGAALIIAGLLVISKK